MTVPSRSINTAGDSGLVMFAVFLETGDKFVSGYGRRSKFAYHNCAPVFGDFRALNRSRSANDPQGKQGNGGIDRALNIENLSCLGRYVMRLFVLLKKHH